MKATEIAVRRPVTTVMIYVALALVGLISLRLLPGNTAMTGTSSGRASAARAAGVRPGAAFHYIGARVAPFGALVGLAA